MSDQLIVEPEARLLVELGQERGVVYEEEIVGLTHELDLDENDVQALRDELVNLGLEIVEQAAAPAEEQVVVEVEIATTNSLDLFLRQAGRYPLLTKDEEVSLANWLSHLPPKLVSALLRALSVPQRCARSRPCRPSRRCVSVIRGEASDSLREGGQIEVCQVLHDVSPDAGQGVRVGLFQAA